MNTVRAGSQDRCFLCLTKSRLEEKLRFAEKCVWGANRETMRCQPFPYFLGFPHQRISRPKASIITGSSNRSFSIVCFPHLAVAAELHRSSPSPAAGIMPNWLTPMINIL